MSSRGLLSLLPMLCVCSVLSTSTTLLPVSSEQEGLEYSHESQQKRPVFLKFYKVGSESVVDFMLRMSVNPRKYKSWVSRTAACDGLPMDHKTLLLYMKYGNDIGAACTRPANRTTSPHALNFFTVLRDPAERFLSQLFFFSGPFTEHYLFTSGQSSVASARRSQNMKSLWKKLLQSPKSISKEDMTRLLKFIKANEEGKTTNVIDEIFFPRLSLLCYEIVFSRQTTPPLKSNDRSLEAALFHMNQLDAVGTMEHMPSFFVLLSLEFGHPLTDSCFLHNRHDNKKPRYVKPRGRDLQPGVMSTIREFVAHDYVIWSKALELHKKQLAAYNYSVESATKHWHDICNALPKTNALSPQIWVDNVRKIPFHNNTPTEEHKKRKKYITHQTEKVRQSANFHASSPSSAKSSDSMSSSPSQSHFFRNIIACVSFTLLFFYLMSKI